MTYYTDDEKPEDYIFKAIPKSQRQAAAQSAETRVTSTIKNAIQEYISRYFNKDGIYREQLKLTAPYSLQYETGISGIQDVDPTVYEVQLARLWKDLRQKLPCIIIADKEFEYHNPGLGGITGSQWISSKTAKVELKLEVRLTLLIEVAAMDETTCSDLRDLLVYIFGPLTILNKSHILCSSNSADKWEIRLPQNFEPSGLERRNVTNDTKDSFFSSGLQLTVDFEGKIDIGFANQLQLITIHDYHEGLIPDGFDENGSLQFKIAEGYPDIDTIFVPETVNLGRPTPIAVKWIPARAMFVSDNPRVGLVDDKCVIIPKRLGTFNVNLMDYTTKPKIIKTWTVRVVSM